MVPWYPFRTSSVAPMLFCSTCRIDPLTLFTSHVIFAANRRCLPLMGHARAYSSFYLSNVSINDTWNDCAERDVWSVCSSRRGYHPHTNGCWARLLAVLAFVDQQRYRRRPE